MSSTIGTDRGSNTPGRIQPWPTLAAKWQCSSTFSTTSLMAIQCVCGSPQTRENFIVHSSTGVANAAWSNPVSIGGNMFCHNDHLTRIHASAIMSRASTLKPGVSEGNVVREKPGITMLTLGDTEKFERTLRELHLGLCLVVSCHSSYACVAVRIFQLRRASPTTPSSTTTTSSQHTAANPMKSCKTENFACEDDTGGQ